MEQPSAFELERRYPGLRGKLPRYPLTRLPTPVEPLDRLGARHGIESLWVKRDDLTSPIYGGNKPRKLELLLGEAKRRGFRTVLTSGGIGTHHGLATVVCARRAGLKTVLLLVPQPVTEHVRRNLLMLHAFGAELRLAESVPGAVLQGVHAYARGLRRRDWPYLIATGGTSVRGTVAYVNAALELAAQIEQELLPKPDFVFVPLGSGGTAAGLAAGFALAGLDIRVVAVLVTDILPPGPRRLAGLGRGALRFLRRLDPSIPRVSLRPDAIEIARGWVGDAYGAVTPAGLEALRELQETHGIGIETTYTAKCMAALLDIGRKPPFAGRPLLFWNTYSSVEPALPGGELPDTSALPTPFRRLLD